MESGYPLNPLRPSHSVFIHSPSESLRNQKDGNRKNDKNDKTSPLILVVFVLICIHLNVFMLPLAALDPVSVQEGQCMGLGLVS
jgi:hypothetical protein